MTYMPLSPILFDSGRLDRRTAARVPLRAQATLVSVFDNHECGLVNVSRSGALIRLARPLALDTSAYLRAGSFEAFAITMRSAKFDEGYPYTGIQFEIPLTSEQVLQLRTWAWEFSMVEKRLSLLAAAEPASVAGHKPEENRQGNGAAGLKAI